MPLVGLAISPDLAGFLVPYALALLDLAMVYLVAQDLLKPERQVLGGNKMLWLAIIVFGSFIGCSTYLLFGRVA